MSVGRWMEGTVELVDVSRCFEGCLEVGEEIIVGGFTSVNVGGRLVLKAIINKRGGGGKVFVNLEILRRVQKLGKVAKIWVFKGFNLERKEVKAVLGEGMVKVDGVFRVLENAGDG